MALLHRDLIFEFGIVSLFAASFSVAGQVCVPESPTSKVGTPSRDIDPAPPNGFNWLSWSIRLSSVFKTPPFLWEMILCMVNVKKWINIVAMFIIFTRNALGTVKLVSEFPLRPDNLKIYEAHVAWHVQQSHG